MWYTEDIINSNQTLASAKAPAVFIYMEKKHLPTFLSKAQEKAREKFYASHPSQKSSNSLYPDKSKSKALSKAKGEKKEKEHIIQTYGHSNNHYQTHARHGML